MSREHARRRLPLRTDVALPAPLALSVSFFALAGVAYLLAEALHPGLDIGSSGESAYGDADYRYDTSDTRPAIDSDDIGETKRELRREDCPMGGDHDLKMVYGREFHKTALFEIVNHPIVAIICRKDCGLYVPVRSPAFDKTPYEGS